MCFSAGNNHQRQLQYYANPVISKSCMHLNNRSFHILQCVQYVYVCMVVVGVSDREWEKARYRENEEVRGKEGGGEALVCDRQREQVIQSKPFSNMLNENSYEPLLN